MGRVRAKFRVMEISRVWNGKSTIVRLLPVMAKSADHPDDPETSAENASFWDATPSGKAKVMLYTLEPTGYELGDCHYIDMEPDPDGDWRMRSRTQTEHQLDVTLQCGWHYEVQMNIGNQGAWPAFAGRVGDPWKVVFSPAPG